MNNRRLHTIRLRRPRSPQDSWRKRYGTHSLASDVSLPFRWNISRRETLGTLLEDRDSWRLASALSDRTASTYRETYDGFLNDLLECAARTLALAGDADIVFVGRSPESIFDLLSGLLADTSWLKEPMQRLTLLRYSCGHTEKAAESFKRHEIRNSFHAYMDTLGLSPEKILVRERPVALVDIVCNGTTIHQLLLLIQNRAVEQKMDWPSVRRKLRVVALVRRSDDIPPKPRWQRRRDGFSGRDYSWRTGADWIDELLEPGGLREAALSSRFWDFIGNCQPKCTPSYPPDAWGSDKATHPCHESYYIAGLRSARHIYEAGCTEIARERFASLLAEERVAMREKWCRNLLTEIRNR